MKENTHDKWLGQRILNVDFKPNTDFCNKKLIESIKKGSLFPDCLFGFIDLSGLS